MMDIYLLNATQSGMNVARLLSGQIFVKGLIGLSNRQFGDSISGGYYCKNDCNAIHIDFIEVTDYTLKNNEDKKKLLDLSIDVLFVVGWQRLVPEWLIEHCGKVIGFHGSPWGINAGRGRSPQNWGLILDEKNFWLSMFYITSSIDSGCVIDTRQFCYSDFDDIKTSQYKVNLLSAEMIISCVNENIQNKGIPQDDYNARYLPQRMPEDGAIDWNSSVNEIYNLIRALTHPFPGAYTFSSNGRITIWKARPFCIDLTRKLSNGEIVEVFLNGDFLVKVEDGFLLIEEYEQENESEHVQPGITLIGVSSKEQLRKIISRHQEKYPQLPIQEKLLNLAK